MLISDITKNHIDTIQTFQWWIDQKRWSWKIQFVVLRDGSWYLETVISLTQDGKEWWVHSDQFDALKTCGLESVVSFTGKLVKHFKKEWQYELQVSSLEVLNVAKDFPLGQKEHGVEFLFDNRHLHLRTKKQRAILRVRDTIIHATYDWMRDHNYIKIDSPIFTPTCAEDSTELYSVTHTNGQEMFLTQSGQLYIEAAIHWHGRVFDFGPCFRAEKSKTRRHLNELRMMDAETAFCDNVMNMDIQESLIKFIMAEVIRVRSHELEILWRDISLLQKTVTEPFLRKRHTEVVQELQALGSDIKDGEDLGADDEEILMNQYDVPLFVTNYPKEIKAFYMPEDPAYPGTVKCADLLAPEWNGEVIWWSERESDYAVLKQKILDNGYELADYHWYLDLRKYGGVQTSWFGFWLERIVRWICGLHHIRETIPFPRYHNRKTP